MRAPLTQSLLATIDSLEPGLRSDVLGGVRRAALDDVRGALPIVWVPFSTHMEIVESLSRVVGNEEYVRVWRKTMTGAFGRPFLRSFVAMSKTLFDFKPQGLLGKSEHIYRHVTRDLGSLTFTTAGENGGVAALWGFPSGFAFREYSEGMRGCFLAGLEILRYTGTAEIVELNEGVGSARFRIDWR
jgi:hypothetical protein